MDTDTTAVFSSLQQYKPAHKLSFPVVHRCVDIRSSPIDTTVSQARLVLALTKAGQGDRAERILRCMNYRPAVCPNGHEPAVQAPCRDAFCPRCSPRALWQFLCAALHPKRAENADDLIRLWSCVGTVLRITVQMLPSPVMGSEGVIRKLWADCLKKAKKVHLAAGASGGFRATHLQLGTHSWCAVTYLALQGTIADEVMKHLMSIPGVDLVQQCDSFRAVAECLRGMVPNALVPEASSDDLLLAAMDLLKGVRRTAAYDAASNRAPCEMRRALKLIRTPIRCPVCRRAVRVDMAGPHQAEELTLLKDISGIEYLSYEVPANARLPDEWRVSYRRLA